MGHYLIIYLSYRKLVDDYLNKIPTPGCKRDLYQLYDDAIYDDAIYDDAIYDDDIKVVNNAPVRDHHTMIDEKVNLNSIGSYNKEISELQEFLECSLIHHKLFEKVGVKPPHGILVCGPRGTGKTFIAR